MRIAVLSGADINAGDFLIVDRAKKLLAHELPGCELVEFKRNVSLEPVLDELNSCDAAVFAGGPGYMRNMYPGRFPLVDDLSRIKPPLFALAMGSFTPAPHVGSYQPTQETMSLLERFSKDGFGLGCRDVLSERVLRSWSIEDTVMTGCAAWYSLGMLDESEPVRSFQPGGTIAISDYAAPSNARLAWSVIEDICKRYAPGRVIFAYHYGAPDPFKPGSVYEKNRIELVERLSSYQVEVHDISGSVTGLDLYRSCDLHVGFRLHAHLFCLSERIPSVLLEEDGRGFGANESLRFPHVCCDMPDGLMRRLKRKAEANSPVSLSYSNSSVERIISQLNSVIDAELEDGYSSSKNSYRIMRETYAVMKGHIGRLKSCEKPKDASRLSR